MIHDQQKMNKTATGLLWFVGVLLVFAVALFAGNYYFLMEEYHGGTSAQVR